MTTARFFCEHCGHEVKPDAAVCPHCGRFFADVRCPRCSQTGTPEQFRLGCPNCGYAGFGAYPGQTESEASGQLAIGGAVPDGWEIVASERPGRGSSRARGNRSRGASGRRKDPASKGSGTGEQLFLIAAVTVLLGLISAVLAFLRT